MAITKGGGGKGGEGFVGSLLLAVAGDKGIIVRGGVSVFQAIRYPGQREKRRSAYVLVVRCMFRSGKHVVVAIIHAFFGHMIRVLKIEKRRTRFGIE